MLNAKCKICRRLGQKLFLRGERCFSPKCAMVRRPYPPGLKRKRRGRGASEYAQQLQAKQQVKRIYGIREGQFKKYVTESLEKKAEKDKSFSDYLIEKLEQRLDNVVFRLGFSKSRNFARQLVVHGHFLVNNRKVDYPSYQLKKDDIIKLKPSSVKKILTPDLKILLKKYESPSWLSLNKESLEAKVLAIPKIEEANLPIDLRGIAEFYSR